MFYYEKGNFRFNNWYSYIDGHNICKQINDTIEIAYNNIKISVTRTRVHSERYGREILLNHSYMRVQHMSLIELFHSPLENVAGLE